MKRRTRWERAGVWFGWLAIAAIGCRAQEPPEALRAASPDAVAPAFLAAGEAFGFDTGLLRGTLRQAGKSMGLLPVIDAESGTELAASLGLFSHYRLLDATARYGTAGWDWPSQARLLPGGAVEVRWAADAEHPFDMEAVYRWTAPGTLDLTTKVTARRALQRFEVFLASYFSGFAATYAYVGPSPQTQGRAGFLEARQESGAWQSFPRDEAAAELFRDGRWTRPPHPVEWTSMPALAVPLAVRRDVERGLTAVLMAPPSDCFAVSMPHSGEGHRSVYLSLFGRDLAPGETAAACARLVLGRGISDAQALALYEAYAAERGVTVGR